MRFGIYPGGYSAASDDAGPPDDPGRVVAALDDLQGAGELIVRGYRIFDDADAPTPARPSAPADLARYAGPRRRLDLVAQFHSVAGDVEGYERFVRALVREHGSLLASLQVTEEPTVTDDPVLDGYYPGVREAVVAGVVAAADEARRLGLDLSVGINVTPLFGPAESFLRDLADVGGADFRAAVDHVGLDFFPDVFSPLVPDLATAVRGILAHHRGLIADAGLDAELWVTENGWPTGPDRAERRQAEVLSTTLAAAAEAGVATYLHFSLRDADSAGTGLLHRFGLMDDAYRAKPAFEVFREAVRRG